VRNLRDTRTRLEKLRDMADHPTANQHEAASARAEIERLKAAGYVEEPSTLSWLDVGRSPDIDTFARRYAEMLRRQPVAPSLCYVCGITLRTPTNYTRCARHVGTLTPGRSGYNAWAFHLKIGDRVSIFDDKPSTGPRLFGAWTIVRQTGTQHVLDGGERFRRSYPYPGLRVGEDGRRGWRTCLIAVDG
jgi:hypothetical protein